VQAASIFTLALCGTVLRCNNNNDIAELPAANIYFAVNLCVANSYSVAQFRVNSNFYHAGNDCYDGGTMRDLAILFIRLLTTITKLMRPGGGRAMLAETSLLRHQLLILSRRRERAPNLRPIDRAVAGLCTTFIRPYRLLRVAVVLRPSTLLAFHEALVKRKYRLLFSPKRHRKPGPKGPSQELIAANVEIKRRNPNWGCRRIAQQLYLVFDLEIDKDMVRRVLAKHYRPDPEAYGPSWLTVLGHAKDSLWSIDLFRCESLMLKNHWVLVAIDQCTRRIIGFGVQAGAVDGPSLCRMFNRAVRGAGSPRYISSDNDPLFRFHQWKANLRILEVTAVKTVPYLPISHPFVERLIGTIRREYVDFVPFWTARDLENKLLSFRAFYNDRRCHYALDGHTFRKRTGKLRPRVADLDSYRWQCHCSGLYQLPVAA